MSLLANWGLVADVDIESEKFRKIGETRFILGMVCEWLRLGKGSLGNQADFDFLPYSLSANCTDLSLWSIPSFHAESNFEIWSWA